MLRAILDTDPRAELDHLGYLRIETPDSKVDVIMVTDGPSYDMFPDREMYHRGPVWHIDVATDGTVSLDPIGIMLKRDGKEIIVVSPSIDVKDRYHTTNPIRFKLVSDFGEVAR